MNFKDYHNLIVNLTKENGRDAFLDMCVADAVFSHIDLAPYDGEGVEEVCQRVKDYWLKAGANVDLDTFAYCIQDQIDNGAYETPTHDCLDEAWEQALECDRQ